MDSVPRMNSEVCWPGPPRRATSTPGTHPQRIAEIRGGLAHQFVAADQVDAREDVADGGFGARRGDDDGIDARDRRRCAQAISVMFIRAPPEQWIEGSPVEAGTEREGRLVRTPGRPPRLALADGPVSGLTACPGGLIASPSHRRFRQWLQVRLRDAACAVYRCGGSAGMAIESRTGFPISPGSRPGHLSSPANVGRRRGRSSRR